MATAETGDTVKVHYTGKLADGSIFDSSRDGEPLQFTIGEDEVIDGFEEAVQGMQTGESKTVEVPAAEAYGARHDERVFRVQRNELPEDLEVDVGQHLEIQDQQGQRRVVRVAGLDEQSIILDANHPLAGEDLTFEIELVEVD